MKSEDKEVKSIYSFIFLNVLSNFIGIIRNKIIAVFYGIQTVGLLGQFNTFNSLQIKLVTFGSQASIINTYNLPDSDENAQSQFLFINFLIISLANLINNLIIIIFLDNLAELIYNDSNLRIYLILGIVLNLFYSLSQFVELSFQAQKKFSQLFYGRLFSFIVAGLAVVPMVFFYDINGVIINLILMYCVSIIYFGSKVSLRSLLQQNMVSNLFSPQAKMRIAVTLKIAATDVLRSGIVLGSLMIIRIFILQYFGLMFSGYYHALIAISNYLNLIAEGFIVFYYPIISSTLSKLDTEKSINTHFETLLILTAPLTIILILSSEYLLQILFSSEFSSLFLYLNWILIFKVVYLFYYITTINFLAKNYLKQFLIIETLRSFLLIIISITLSFYLAFTGAIYSLVICDLITSFLIYFIFRKKNYPRINRQNIILILKILFLNGISALYIISLPYRVILVFVFFIILMDLNKYKNLFSILIKSLAKNK